MMFNNLKSIIAKKWSVVLVHLRRIVSRFDRWLMSEKMAKRFGQPILGMDYLPGQATYVLTYHWRGHVYVIEHGTVKPGGYIMVPPKTKIIHD